MTRDEFWAIVDRSRRRWDTARADGNMDRQSEDLRELLSSLPPNEVAGFEQHAEELFHAAYRWDLWHAADIIGMGCSDDGFDYFRGWLISMGRSNYERALAAPESLADIARAPGVEDIFFEGFLSVLLEVYETQAGEELEATPYPDQPSGDRIPEEEFPIRFPRLWKTFGSR